MLSANQEASKKSAALIFTQKNEIRNYVNELKNAGFEVGFVPTMGCLHEGHLSLIKRSVKETDMTVVSIFLNPTQFGPNEDLDKYPKQFETDLFECEKLGVAAIFAPSKDEMYSNGLENIFKVIPPEEYIDKLCGKFRPGHFEGVATVVTKLFNCVPAQKGYFGQKDAQQLFIIRKLVEHLDFNIEIVACPTVREPDGLACSSRNLNLDSKSRKLAPYLFKTLNFINDAFMAGKTDFNEISIIARQEFIDRFEQIHLEYLLALDYNSLKFIDKLKPYTLIAIAAKIGGVRLIDNIILSQN